MSARRVLIAAGGTGGHLFPAAAFAEALRARGWTSILMTDERGRRYAEGFPADGVIDVPAATIGGLNPVRNARAAVRIVRGVIAADGYLKAHPANLVAGFGGYPSLPALQAARGRIPILIHEQNAVLGRTNRAFARAAAIVACGFERLDRLPANAGRKVIVGNPVRPAILVARDVAYVAPGPDDPVHVLVTGGSQGARILGEVVPAAMALLDPALKARLRVTQQVREEQLPLVRTAYEKACVAAELAPFFRDMGDRLARSCLFIGRAGASTVSELSVAGRPAILTPLAIAADDHQSANAAALVDVGAADALPEYAFRPRRLADLLTLRLGDPVDLARRAAAARAAGRPDAAERLADLAETLVRAPAPGS
jgi:UDP-N-acetylglucosamine--N-acetylmuramyl-(pentapeptide) pyrophosphoryl-undecaprenol N-acetylglucosamine transferase